MTTLSRRQWLAAALGAVAMAPLPGSVARATVAGSRPRRIRYFVQIVLSGGVDQVLTAAPRVAKDVDAGIDVPYAADAIVPAGALALGPHMSPLAPHADRLTLLHGVRIKTAGHPSGATHLSRLRTRVTNAFPAFIDTFGSYREGTVLGSINLNESDIYFAPDALVVDGTSPAPIGLTCVQGLQPSDLVALEGALSREASSLERLGGAERVRIADRLRATVALYRKLPTIPTFRLESDGWGTMPPFAVSMQRTLWLIENDLAAGIEVVPVVMDWDSHEDNLESQTQLNVPAFTAIARFIAELSARSNADGKLIDQTLIVIGSDMGRFPRLNARLGKDHSPEVPLIVLDPARRGGHVFGTLGRQLEALPMSTTTGRSGRDDPMMMDDVGTTLLRRLGISPEVHGYLGRRLQFLDV